tara:strand:+ start:22159 stop:24363 length:2205 start_codon:yes stop_codon:yes gene_type:complete
MAAIDYSDHEAVLKVLGKDQDAEQDNREKVRECHYFIEKDDGMWEPSIWNKMSKRPRYTFDLTTPIIDQIVNEMDGADFDVRVRPAGGDATKETARVMDGMIRNIENMSNAQHIYMDAGRGIVVGGMGGWEVVQDWGDTDGFEQDLYIRPISDYVNRVWFDCHAERQDQSDANHVFKLSDMSPEEYEDKWPEGKKQSISAERSTEVYTNKAEVITIGCIKWKKPVTKTLHLMTNGAVYEENEKFNQVKDELAEQNVTIKRSRTTESHKVCSRHFDNGGWLDDAVDTVFEYLPIVPAFANFRISDGKTIYKGKVERLMDAQRVFNYSKSREVEDAVLAPKPLYWMTNDQAAGHEEELSNLNTTNDPVQFYNPDPEQPGGPMFLGGAQVNQGMNVLSGSMAQQIQATAGMFGINQGQQDSAMSGIAIQSLQNKGDNATRHFFSSMEVAITYCAKVLVNAIPKVYDSERMVRVLGEDNSEEMIKINERIYDQESRQFVELNDLTKGKYDVVCDVGPAFKNRQQEATKAFQELSQVIPGLADITADIQLKNIPSPGMDLAAERVRRQLIQNGVIPESQLTQEEIQEQQQAQELAAQQPKELTPDEKIAQAETARVEAETADIMSKAQERQHKGELEELKLMMQQQKDAKDDEKAMFDAFLKGQAAIFSNQQMMANTLKSFKEVMGVDSIATPELADVVSDQIEILAEQQESIEDAQEREAVQGATTQQLIEEVERGRI